jgi:adenylate cyclase
MSDVFISYAHSTAPEARAAAETLRTLGYSVWLDEDLPVNRAFTHAIEEELTKAKAALVIWSADATKSEWVLSEANRAREAHKLVQVAVDKTRLPMPFDQIQCADLSGWSGEGEHPAWRKVAGCIAELVGATPRPSSAAKRVSAAAPTAPPLPSKPSLAVMPFANLSNDPEQDYFADGMMEEIVTGLSRIRSIFVIASGSTLSLKGKGLTPDEAARQLGVRYVLEGSVRKAQGRVRIAVKLIDAIDSAQIWADRFEDTLEDVFALQDKVALAVAGKIEPAVLEAEIRQAAKRPTENMGSYDLFLRALPLSRTYVENDMLEAIDLAERAIALDPDFASVLAFWALWKSQAIGWGWSDDPAGQRQLGIERAHRALRLAGDDPEVMSVVALAVLHLERDVTSAAALIDRAVELNPGSAVAWIYRADIQQVAGRTEMAVESVRTSMRLDPISPYRHMQVGITGMARFQERRFDEAVPLFKEWIQRSADPGGHALLASTYGHLGRLSAARELIAECAALSPTPVELLGKYWYREPAQRALFLEGLALAEGKAPSDGPTGSPR